MYALTKIKTFTGMEGYGLNATIIKDGKPIAFVLDDANGGCTMIDFRNATQKPSGVVSREIAEQAEKEFSAFAMNWYITSGAHAEFVKSMKEMGSLPESAYEAKSHNAMDSWVNAQADDHANKKRLDRAAKTKTLFRIEGDSTEEWRTIAKAYCPEVEAFLSAKYGSKVAAIYGVK